MTTDSAQTPWTVQGLLDLFDVQPDGENRFIAETGLAGEDERQVVEGTQVLAQAIVAVAKRFPDKSVRSVYAVFARAVMVGAGPVELEIDVVSEGRSTATAIVAAKQNGKRCITMTVLADVPTDDVIRHHLPRPEVAAPADANVSEMPMVGRQLRLVDVVDVNSPDEVGPPELYAWLHYDPIPTRDDLAKALIAYFTGHLGISTTMRAHEGIGTAQAHLTVSTAPMTVSVSFHEPVRWDGWLLYTHESTQVGAGMSYVRGAVHTEEGELIASFAQDALIRPLRTTGHGDQPDRTADVPYRSNFASSGKERWRLKPDSPCPPGSGPRSPATTHRWPATPRCRRSGRGRPANRSAVHRARSCGPNCSSASATTRCCPAASRTSTSSARIFRPSPSTRLTVSARSSCATAGTRCGR